MAMQLQRVCHDTLPWLISFSLDVSAQLGRNNSGYGAASHRSGRHRVERLQEVGSSASRLSKRIRSIFLCTSSPTADPWSCVFHAFTAADDRLCWRDATRQQLQSKFTLPLCITTSQQGVLRSRCPRILSRLRESCSYGRRTN